jgi:predicted nucleic acid binding AN1-type Zn finger protein
MEVKVCKNCRRLFQYVNGPELCPECMKLLSKEEKQQFDRELKATLKPLIAEDEEKFNQVRDYIMAHPRASLLQISEANDIKPIKLLEWVKQERLEFSDDSKEAWFECVKCGKKIKSGTLCNQCKNNN